VRGRQELTHLFPKSAPSVAWNPGKEVWCKLGEGSHLWATVLICLSVSLQMAATATCCEWGVALSHINDRPTAGRDICIDSFLHCTSKKPSLLSAKVKNIAIKGVCI